MKSILKKMYSGTGALFQTIVSLFSVLFFSKSGKPNIKTLSNCFENKNDCYLLGTGPSLNDIIENNDLLEGKTCMVMNNFFRSDYFKVIKPQFLVLVDPAYFRDIKDTFSTASREDMIAAMNTIDWPLTLIVPYEFNKSVTKKRITNKQIQYCFINNIPIDGFRGVCFYLYRKGLGMPWPGNVMIAAIFCCINIGFKKIHLLGAEHSWTKDLRVNESNQVCYYDDHFYDNKSMRVIPNTNIASMLEQIAKGFRSHQQLNAYAQSRGCEVINNTSESFIDAYKRESLIQ